MPTSSCLCIHWAVCLKKYSPGGGSSLGRRLVLALHCCVSTVCSAHALLQVSQRCPVTFVTSLKKLRSCPTRSLPVLRRRYSAGRDWPGERGVSTGVTCLVVATGFPDSALTASPLNHERRTTRRSWLTSPVCAGTSWNGRTRTTGGRRSETAVTKPSSRRSRLSCCPVWEVSYLGHDRATLCTFVSLTPSGTAPSPPIPQALTADPRTWHRW